MMGLVLWDLLCVLLCAPVLLAACPARCECSEPALTVKCVSKDLQNIPTGIPGYTRNLFITGNHISRIGPESFKGLDNLTTLSLSNNGIRELESQAFSSLHSLLHLDLSSNQLTLIHPEAFVIPGGALRELNLSGALLHHSSGTDLARSLRWGTLGELRRLDLSGNGLAHLPSCMFSHLPSLRRLRLANNSLVVLKNGTFSGLEWLEELDLTRNSFRTFQGESLGELEALPSAQLFLGQNPFTCSCSIEDFARWLNSSHGRVADVARLVCAFPTELQNTSLLETDELDRACRASQGTDLTLQTSYVFLGVVLGFVGVVFLFVLYLNRKGIKRWMFDTRDACREALEGYHYRMEIDSDPRLAQVSTTSDL
ncbi:trophoblast glycoprotein-like [Megalops cyprinoides]|uniref:trophoblast glycoprotein-like n=1 Tax=Megalops cyprinoides TaxID=118141 RepID=UPI0018653FB7|nr:trophoblast glycoprotein-like [Megalops cyprinoides]